MASKKKNIIIVTSIFAALTVIVILAAIPKNIYSGSRFEKKEQNVTEKNDMKQKLLDKINDDLITTNEKWQNITTRTEIIFQKRDEELKDQLSSYEKAVRMHTNLKTTYYNATKGNLTRSNIGTVNDCLDGRDKLTLDTVNLSIAKSRDCLHDVISKFREKENYFRVSEPVEKLNWNIMYISLKNETNQCVMKENKTDQYSACLLTASHNVKEQIARVDSNINKFYTSLLPSTQVLLETMQKCREGIDYPVINKLVEMDNCIEQVKSHASIAQIVSNLLLILGAIVLSV